jgi:methylamine utilization protein MauE
MAESIAPVVYGDRRRWRAALALHAAGATVAAASFGAVLGWAGSALGAPWGSAGLLLVSAAGAAYALREVVPGLAAALPVPQARRQVPDWWRTFFSWPASAALYGAGLGVGFFTYLAHGALLVVAVGAAAGGRPLVGAALVAPFGLARGLSPWVARNVGSADEGRRLVDRLAESSESRRRLANALGLAVVAAVALVAWSRARPPDQGAWSRLAAAALAITFAWAATAKLVARRRWIRSLEAHRLPAAVARLARSGVPVAEALVPALVVLGLPRAAAWWAILLLVTFTAAALRTSGLGGGTVPCGCFGGRDRVDVRVAAVRNALLAGIAALVVASASDATLLGGLTRRPAAADALPVALVAGGLAVAAATAWRAAAWLRRGSHA